MRNEAEKANIQREEELKEIEKLKVQIYLNNNDDSKKGHVHHVIVIKDGNQNRNMNTQTGPSPIKKNIAN